MRVTNNMNYDTVKSQIHRNRSDMGDLQNQAATMKRITTPSDDPVATARSLGIRSSKAATEQFMKNIDMAKIVMNYSEAALAELTEVLVKAKEVAISQSSDASSSAASRIALATQVDQMFNDMVSIGNRKFGERFIFGGFRTTVNPFNEKGEYQGDTGAVKIEINKEVYTPVNVPGNLVFLGDGNQVGLIPDNQRGSTVPITPPIPPRQGQVDIRRPSSLVEEEKQRRAQGISDSIADQGPELKKGGENLFQILRDLSIGLRSNDTKAIQETLERIDTGIEQVVMLRSEMGARISSLENTTESLSKSKVDDLALLSSLEDADPFEVFTDMTKNENTLKATLQTSGKLIQPSLLDFLR